MWVCMMVYACAWLCLQLSIRMCMFMRTYDMRRCCKRFPFLCRSRCECECYETSSTRIARWCTTRLTIGSVPACTATAYCKVSYKFWLGSFTRLRWAHGSCRVLQSVAQCCRVLQSVADCLSLSVSVCLSRQTKH